MEDDDEFGDLYADVLLPSTAPYPPVPAANPPSDLTGDGRIPYGNPNLPASPSPDPPKTIESVHEDEAKDDWLIGGAPADVEQPENWEDDEISDRPPVAPAPELAEVSEPRVLQEEEGARVSEEDADVVKGGEFRITEENGDEFVGGGSDKKTEIGDSFEELMIPGVSDVPLVKGDTQALNVRDAKGGSEDWDSDSEDDLHIVLNERKPVMFGGDDDDDGDELVILADADQGHHHQAMDEQEWGDEAMQATVDGEKKEILEPGKVNSSAENAPGARIGHNNQGFHPQHHSMYKYVRPGASFVPGGSVVGAIGGPGQIRPPPAPGSIAGRGRGDWRPAGIRGFSSGYGLPGWANSNPGRSFGNGFDFTLPSHKTIFDVDIEGFEEKPWRYPGADSSDFFNFGLDEDNWKDYCKQLEQLRLEATMQSKICVYESGRPEREYDPDLPPELAAAAGNRDSSVDNMNHLKVDNEKDELNGQGKGVDCIQAALPIGRTIQVELGYGERLPSIDTRPQRIRDSDSIIEIVLQDSLEENDTSKLPEKDLRRDPRGVHDFMEDDKQAELEYFDRFPHNFNAHKREIVARKAPFAPEGDGILPFPSELPHQYHPNSKLRSPVNIHGPVGAHPGGRLPHKMSRGRHSSKSGEHSVDKISARSSQGNRHHTHRREVPGDSSEGNHTSAVSPILVVGNARGLSLERRDGEDDDDGLALGDDSFEAGEDLVSDIQGIPDDDCLISSAKKQNIRSRVEQPPHQETGGHDDPRASNSDGSRAKSGSSKDYQKRRECGEEVMQDGRERPIGDLRKRHEEEQNFQRKDDYGRDGRHGDRDRVASKGREVAYHSYTHRGWDPNTVRGRSEGFVRSKEMNGTATGRQRRDDDIHSRRNKDEDTRRERHEETRSRDMNRVKASDKNNKDDGVHSRKQVDDGDWRGARREVVPRQQRDRDGMLMRRREVDDGPLSKKKEEDHLRRGKDDKEDSGRRKRERDDGAADLRRRDDDIRKRDKAEDHHSVKHRDDSWRQRGERDESQRHKQPREDLSSHRDREGRGGTRNGRASEDKPLSGNIKNKDNSKAMVADKENHHRDRKQQDEQVKRSDRASERNHSQNKGREDVQAHEKPSHNEERSSRRQRLSSHSDRPSNASSNQQTHREKHREVANKSKDLDVSEQNPQESVKKKQGDYNTQRNEKVSLKGSSEQESNGVSSARESKKARRQNNEGADEVEASHSGGKVGEEDQGSDEESQKGRSKLERWTSQKERDYSAIKGGAAEMVHGDDESIRMEAAAIGGADESETSAKVVMEVGGEDQDLHLDTIAKLKRRSERFKLPMPGEETSSSNKAEGEAQTNGQDEVYVDVEIMPERPARKRRWTTGI